MADSFGLYYLAYESPLTLDPNSHLFQGARYIPSPNATTVRKSPICN